MIPNADLPFALFPISENGAGPLAIMNQNEMHQTLWNTIIVLYFIVNFRNKTEKQNTGH